MYIFTYIYFYIELSGLKKTSVYYSMQTTRLNKIYQFITAKLPISEMDKLRKECPRKNSV